MASEIEEYKILIDGIVQFKGSVSYILEQAQAGTWSNEHYDLFREATDEQKKAILEIMRKVASSSIHDVLVYLRDNGYSFFRNETKVGSEPFGNPIYYDYISRLIGEEWPE